MEQRGIKDIQLTGEMKKSFMEYAMSVIVARALPRCERWFKASTATYYSWYE